MANPREANRLLAAALALYFPLPLLAAEGTLAPLDWPQFRGRQASGVADGSRPPVSWDGAKGTNLRWKTPIPGLGHSSPIVAGDRVFITTAVSGDPGADLRIGLYGDIAPVTDETRHSWRVACLDRKTGKVLWERTAREGVPLVKRHPKATHANSTPATDGTRVVAFFGSEGLHAYDLDGNLLWTKDLGLLDSAFYMFPSAQWGFGSSPIVHEGRVIIQCDVLKDSFLAAFDIKTGDQVWRTPRSDVPTWSTPAIVSSGSRTELVVNGYRHAGGYDPLTGKELWKLGGGGDIPVPTPIAAHGLIVLSSAHGPQAPLLAVRAGAVGDITLAADADSGPHVAWAKKRDGIYMQTPIIYGDHLYACRDHGVLGCYELETGKRLYQERLGGGRTGFTASAVAADGKLYFTSEEGDVHVVQAGPEFKLLGTNPVGEACLATPAIAEGMFIVRAKGHVYCFAGEPPAKKKEEGS
jgi:outer membrane protein assembly factor BamB